MDYPGRLVAVGEPEDSVVLAIRGELQAHGYAADAGGPFDQNLSSVVRLFQSQNVDLDARPLKVDGKVGPNTWGSLFGHATVNNLSGRALAFAQSQIGVREVPPGSNSGPQVDQYLKSAGGAPGEPWCMSFVYWCFEQAAKPEACPVPRSPGVLDVLDRARKSHPDRFISVAAAVANPQIVLPGWIFILDHGGGHGHTGFVKVVNGGGITTVEGNTNIAASREGLGVFELNRRSITDDELVGFLDFSRP